MSPLLIVLVGLLGGVVRGVLGYSNQSSRGEDFDWLKFGKSVLRAGIADSVLVYTTMDITTGSTTLYITAFFMAIGADVALKEGYKTIIKKGLLNKLSDWIR